ncbi:hypothetical protein CLTEP_10610 [Clostridium tepidiprofundi DSM 19306]|uniref:TIGR02679 family protein n=1 Tax=Clostridium tepidiprofundi DSM 19306 TaxID=1121338 RepID=A0A151B585_9CLOT|nr:TIGR02679 domain-containing protein [Clostridium tepidiprofundi]KYH35068.1 hypothetical protein CLTEP_10610 [Clostridium tepidiprofundi DSM 19306]
MDKVNEAVEFLKKNKAYNKILKEILIKYKKLGKLSGMICMENLTSEEAMILAPLNHNFFAEKKGKFSVKKFMDNFSKGRFEGVDFVEVLKVYFDDNLITNKEKRDLETEKREKYFKTILEQCEGTRFEIWLNRALCEKKYGYKIIMKKYCEDKKVLKEILMNIKKALCHMSFSSDNITPIALFSSNITKDSHYFDIGTVCGNLLMHAICCILDVAYPENAEKINEILYSVGIMRDELSNTTITYGLKAYTDCKEHFGFKSFYDYKEPLIVSLKNLNKIDTVKVNNNRVFVFENPTVLVGVMEKTKHIYPSLICTSGQINICSLVLLDKIVRGGAVIYYSGDFDPEGLKIADKLKRRYKDKLVLWRYSIEDYFNIKSSVSIKSRESKLSSIECEELFELRDILIDEGKGGYQELLIEEYVKDIIELTD